jgi:hypothetical protein
MTIKRPRRNRSEQEIDDVSWRFLCDATTIEDETADESTWTMLTLRFNETTVAEPPTGKQTAQLWEEFGPDIVTWWAKEKPGTRPRCWWNFSAPEPRRRVGGTGVTTREAIGGEVHISSYGLPDSEGWMMPKDKRWLPQSESGLPAFDTADPPSYESQASYLKRLALLEPGEEKRLKPDAFAPAVQALPSLRRQMP